MKELTNYKNMLSKILIDVDEQGLSTIKITQPSSSNRDKDYPIMDVKDKLVKRFLEGGMFAFISYEGDVADIHSMNAAEVLKNIKDIFGGFFQDIDQKEDFDKKVDDLLDMIKGF